MFRDPEALEDLDPTGKRGRCSQDVKAVEVGVGRISMEKKVGSGRAA